MVIRHYLLTGLFAVMVSFSGSHEPKAIQKNQLDPFQPGEELTYKVRYSVYFNLNVGEVNFKVKGSSPEKNDSTCKTIVAKGKTLGLYDPFFKVRDHYETCVDFDEMVPNYFMRDVREGDYTFRDKLVFDHQSNLVVNKEGDKFSIPDKTQDILSSLYYARTFNFENATKGDSAMIHTFIDDTTYRVGLRYEGKEVINTEFGEYKCLKIKPILIVGRIFDSKYDMTLWVTDDQNKIPLRVESGLTVGSIRADLKEYDNLKYPFMAGK